MCLTTPNLTHFVYPVQKKYDEINFLNPNEIIQGDNGQDEYGKVQSVMAILVHRRLRPYAIASVLCPNWCRTVHPVEVLVVDQYDNHYYMLHAVLSDGAVYTFCERVRTFEEKKNYELQDGWNESLWNRLRDKGREAIASQQLEILAERN